jgi:hypothetical protein
MANLSDYNAECFLKTFTKFCLTAFRAFGMKPNDMLKLQRYVSFRVASLGGGQRFYITARGKMALILPLVKTDDLLAHVRGGYMLGILR